MKVSLLLNNTGVTLPWAPNNPFWMGSSPAGKKEITLWTQASWPPSSILLTSLSFISLFISVTFSNYLLKACYVLGIKLGIC